MLQLLFYVGDDCYVVDYKDIKEVVPCLQCEKMPQEGSSLPYLLYHGVKVPVVDFCELMKGRPARAALSTRLILLQYGQELIALVAERVTEVVDEEKVSPLAKGSDYPFLEKGEKSQSLLVPEFFIYAKAHLFFGAT